jgi:hypothetical protein
MSSGSPAMTASRSYRQNKGRTFPAWSGGGPPYFEAVRDAVDNGYRGFRFDPGVDTSASASESFSGNAS